MDSADLFQPISFQLIFSNNVLGLWICFNVFLIFFPPLDLLDLWSRRFVLTQFLVFSMTLKDEDF